MKKTVVVGMSGGVDSSVSALLLKEQGYNVIGMFMKNWEEKDANGICTSAQDYADVVSVCSKLDIPYYSINFVKEYWDQVFADCLEEFKAGFTPNPDILCNREIKFKVFLEKALELGADYLATGHYCQIHKPTNLNGNEQEYCLLKGAEHDKDQSYFIYTIKETALRKVLFPVGHLTKFQVRSIAEKHGLSTAQKKGSTGICFIGERDFKKFLTQYIAYHPGNFEDSSGKIIGQHHGISYYTIGQRRGLNIGGPGEAWFVVGKDIPRNVIIIEQGEKHPALYCDELTATDFSWISAIPLESHHFPLRCSSKIRYRQQDEPCTIISWNGVEGHVVFDNPQRAVTPRQSIVFYDGERCLGGAIIKNSGPSYAERGLSLSSDKSI